MPCCVAGAVEQCKPYVTSHKRQFSRASRDGSGSQTLTHDPLSLVASPGHRGRFVETKGHVFRTIVADNLSRTVRVIPEKSTRKREGSKLDAADTELSLLIKGDERFSSRLYKPYS